LSRRPEIRRQHQFGDICGDAANATAEKLMHKHPESAVYGKTDRGVPELLKMPMLFD
jgi:hypothetical protein